jgi:hypothetical protein
VRPGGPLPRAGPAAKEAPLSPCLAAPPPTVRSRLPPRPPSWRSLSEFPRHSRCLKPSNPYMIGGPLPLPPLIHHPVRWQRPHRRLAPPTPHSASATAVDTGRAPCPTLTRTWKSWITLTTKKAHSGLGRHRSRARSPIRFTAKKVSLRVT